MPHLFVNRPRAFNLKRPASDRRAQFRWETINAMVYKVGGVMFVAGSIFFFPRFAAYESIGLWIFLAGSLLFLLVTAHDMAEALRYRRTGKNPTASALELTAAFSYLTGTLLFTLGSVLFFPSLGVAALGTWCFLAGSLLFVVGACINVLQIVRARNLMILQLMNLTAISFVVGSVLFTVATVPYLWRIRSAGDRWLIDDFVAWQFVAGSLLFLLGGLFNYLRAYLVERDISVDLSSGSGTIKFS